jgi:single-strand DNA-binding protein|tara:strand:- start:3291 stop:3659 length:369 start_codon:yes stop_codon:yes gene_type:complete
MYNTIVAAGYLVSDPEVREVSSKKFCKLRMCVSSNRAKEPCFIDVEFWNRQAEIAEEYLKKGRSIIAQGELRSSSWEKDGKKNTKQFIAGQSFQFLNVSQQDDENKQQSSGSSSKQEEDVPF